MNTKLTSLLSAALLAAPFAAAQEDRGEQTEAIVPRQPAAVAVPGGRSLAKEVVVTEEPSKWWAFNAYTGWDSLYMYRGVNVLGNGNGIFWIAGDVGVTPWENGAFTVGAWYGIGSYYDTARHQETYAELDITADYTHRFGAFALSTGYSCYYYPNSPDAQGSDWTVQNEIYLKAAYDFTLGGMTLTPNMIYYYDLGPAWGEPHGITNGGSSYLVLRLDGSVPVFKEIVALKPYTALGINFGFNNQWIDGNTDQNRFTGANNWELGVAVPVSFTSWFSVSPYVAYSYQWQNLPTYNEGSPFTDVNTWWAGVKATLSF